MIRFECRYECVDKTWREAEAACREHAARLRKAAAETERDSKRELELQQQLPARLTLRLQDEATVRAARQASHAWSAAQQAAKSSAAASTLTADRELMEFMEFVDEQVEDSRAMVARHRQRQAGRHTARAHALREAKADIVAHRDRLSKLEAAAVSLQAKVERLGIDHEPGRAEGRERSASHTTPPRRLNGQGHGHHTSARSPPDTARGIGHCESEAIALVPLTACHLMPLPAGRRTPQHAAATTTDEGRPSRDHAVSIDWATRKRIAAHRRMALERRRKCLEADCRKLAAETDQKRRRVESLIATHQLLLRKQRVLEARLALIGVRGGALRAQARSD